VLAEHVAEKIFGTTSPVGKILLLGDERIPIEVTGVVAKQPDNAHFHFDYLLSLHTNPNIKKFEWSWIWTQMVTYVKLKPGTQVSELEGKFSSMAEDYVKPMFSRFGIDYQEFTKGKEGWSFYLQPVKDIQLYSDTIGNRIGPVGDIKYIYIFGTVAIFVLLLAIINFVNLTTARGANRAKEVGVKKTLGAPRKLLIFQFQFESILLAAIAVVVGLGMMEFLRNMIQDYLPVDLPMVLVNENIWWMAPFLAVTVGLLAGVYPSFYLTAFRPVNVLKGKVSLGFKKSGLRNVLVVTQFVIALLFIVFSALVHQQLKYFNEKDLGFDRSEVLVVNHAEKMGTHLETFRHEISTIPGVRAASLTMDVPGRGSWEDIFRKDGDDTQYPISCVKIDPYYIPAMKMDLLAGRNYDESRPGDIDGVIINETTAKLFGWQPEDAIGEQIIYIGDNLNALEVIGVVKDFHFQSLNTNIAPHMFFHINSKMWGDQRLVTIKFATAQVHSILEQLEEKWNNYHLNAPLEYSFLDDEWNNKYQQEKAMGGLFTVFSGLSIIIAILGLVGLVTYSAEQRRKEIGIRKTFGASISQILMLFNTNFTKLVLISFIIAVPIAWYAANQWLQQYTYRIEFGPGIFIFSGLLILLITWGTVSLQSLKTALTNPTDVLKEE
jgi:putative ABC transport system permease protein